MIAFLILFIVNLLVLYTAKEPERLVEVKEKYRILREHISANGPKSFICSGVVFRSRGCTA